MHVNHNHNGRRSNQTTSCRKTNTPQYISTNNMLHLDNNPYKTMKSLNLDWITSNYGRTGTV